MNIDGVLRGLVTHGANWVLWLLVALSVLSLTVVLERLLFFARTRGNASALRAELSQDLGPRDLEAFQQRLATSLSLEACIVGAGLRSSSPREAEERMAAEALLQRLRSERFLVVLGTLGNNAPFVGLLGTVFGIIGAFAQLDASGGQLTTGLMAEIGEALVATAIGLLVALPAVAAYNAFQRTIQVRLQRGEALGRIFVARLHAGEVR